MALQDELQQKQELEKLRAQQRIAGMKETFLGYETPEEKEESVSAEKQESQGMGLGLFVPMLVFCIILDTIDALTAGTIGWAIGLVGDGIILLVMGTSRGAQKQIRKMLIAVIGESIPGVATLPLRTLFIVWSYISSRPRVAKTLGKVANLAKFAGPQGQAVSRGFAVASKIAGQKK